MQNLHVTACQLHVLHNSYSVNYRLSTKFYVGGCNARWRNLTNFILTPIRGPSLQLNPSLNLIPILHSYATFHSALPRLRSYRLSRTDTIFDYTYIFYWFIIDHLQSLMSYLDVLVRAISGNYTLYPPIGSDVIFTRVKKYFNSNDHNGSYKNRNGSSRLASVIWFVSVFAICSVVYVSHNAIFSICDVIWTPSTAKQTCQFDWESSF